MRKKLIIISIIMSISFSALGASPGLSGTLSIIPGLGQVANGRYLEGLTWFTAVGGLLATKKSKRAQQIGFDLWQYNMYDSYRDAGNKQSTFLGEYFSNYNPINAFDMIGTPILLLSSTQLQGRNVTGELILEMSFVGLGEEGLFRGFLFPAFSQMFNSKWTGAIVSSAIFSYIHLDGAKPIPFRFVMGMLFCWQADRNKYDLSNNIFAHTWYDVMVSSDDNKINGFKIGYDFKF